MRNILVLPIIPFTLAISHAAQVEFPQDAVPPGMPTTVNVGEVTYRSLAQMSQVVKDATAPDLVTVARGYEIMADPVTERRENYRERLRQQADIQALITVKLADVTATDLGSYLYEGLIPDGPIPAGPWTSVIRVYQRPDNVKVFLQECDYVADGGAIVIIKELMNAKVNTIPAYLMLKKAGNGAQMTDLSWASDKKYYVLSVWDDATKDDGVSRYGKTWLLNLAGKLN